MRTVLSVCALLALAACAPEAGDANAEAATAAPATITPVATEAPAGEYTLDKAHASLIFRVNHLGFSNYTARFKRFDAMLQFDPADPTRSSVTATIDPTSIETDYPDPQTLDFNAMLQSQQWLNTAQFPQMTFRSTRVDLTGPDTLRIEGNLELNGVTRPVVLDTTFNGGYVGHPMDPRARIGFSARGTLRRSEFGIDFGIPEPGTTMGVSDAVEVLLELEFSGPPMPDAQATH